MDDPMLGILPRCMRKMAFMTITTLSQKRLDAARRRSRGFTLVEMMVGATISTIILAGTLSTFLYIGRSGMNLRNYNDMEAQARKSLEIFAEDTRQASAVAWASPSSVKLIVDSKEIFYTYASGQFTRTTTTSTTTLLTGITQF